MLSALFLNRNDITVNEQMYSCEYNYFRGTTTIYSCLDMTTIKIIRTKTNLNFGETGNRERNHFSKISYILIFKLI